MSEQKSAKEARAKVLFQLEQDEDGYPPVSVESLWAKKTADGFYELDNIPFYVRGISCRDVVDTYKGDEGQLYFGRVIRRSGNSTVRVLVLDAARRNGLLKDLAASGCTWEGSNQPNLIAVNIPPTCDLAAILEFLKSGHDREHWDYEEACLSQDL